MQRLIDFYKQKNAEVYKRSSDALHQRKYIDFLLILGKHLLYYTPLMLISSIFLVLMAKFITLIFPLFVLFFLIWLYKDSQTVQQNAVQETPTVIFAWEEIGVFVLQGLCTTLNYDFIEISQIRPLTPYFFNNGYYVYGFPDGCDFKGTDKVRLKKNIERILARNGFLRVNWAEIHRRQIVLIDDMNRLILVNVQKYDEFIQN